MAAFNLFIAYIIITFCFVMIVVVDMAPLEKITTKIICPQGSNLIMDDTSQRPCYRFVESKKSYFMASQACKAGNGYIPGINSNFRDISITSLAQNLRLLYREDFFWLGCYKFNESLTCEDGIDLNGYDNWAKDNDPTRGSCAVVSLSSGKWKSVNCLERFVFACEYEPKYDGPSTTPKNDPNAPMIPPFNETHHSSNITIIVKVPNYTGLLWGLFGLIIFIFICLQCLCFQCYRCLDNLGYFNPSNHHRRRYYDDYNYNNNQPDRYYSSPGRGRSRIWSQISSMRNIGSHYSPDPSDEIRLLEEQQQNRERTFSNFSSFNNQRIPQSSSNNNYPSPPRSVIIRIPPNINPANANIEELLRLHGHYANYPSLSDRSEISSILQNLQNYIPRSQRDYTLPPPDPLYSIDSNGNINIDLCRVSNISPLPSPPPYQSDFNLPRSHSPQNVIIDPIILPQPLRSMELNIPTLMPAPRVIEYNEFATQIRRAQNRMNENDDFSEEERILKKQIY